MTDVRFVIRADGDGATREVERVKQSLNTLPAAARTAQGGLDGMGMSAAQTAQAMRQVPMQVTDIVTSLASGQPVMMVAIQQGGQLKDAFGGIVPAAKALSSTIAGMVNPFTLAAAAAAAVGAAWYQGQQEAQAYAKALILSGNAIGMTTTQLEQMASTMASTVGTQGLAASALAEMAGSSAIASRDLQRFTEVAIEWERVTGQSVADTRKAFEELAGSPLDALIELNDGTNFLTASLFDQVKALQEQGRETEAAELAQRGYASALEDRAGKIESNLGIIERSWRAVTGAAKSAWDAMLDIGRQSTEADKLARIERDLEAAKTRAAGGFGQSVSRGAQAQVEALEAQRDAMKETMRLSQRMSDAEAERSRVERAAVAERVKAHKDEEEQAKKSARSAESASKARIRAIEAERQAREKLEEIISSALGRDEERQRKDEAEAAAAAIKLWEQEAEARTKAYEAADKQVTSFATLLANIQLETQYLQMSNSEREFATAMRELEVLGVEKGTAAWEAYAEALRGAIGERATVKAGIEASAALVRSGERAADQVGQAFAQSIMDGGKSAADQLERLFGSMVLTPMVNAVVNPMAQAVTGAFSGGGSSGGGSSAVGTIGQIAGLSGAFGTGLGASFGSMASAGIGGWASAAGSLMGSGSMAGVMAGAGMVAAPLLAAYALYSLLSQGGEKRAGSTYGYSASDLQYGQGLNGIWSDEVAGMIGAGSTRFIGGPSGGEIGGDAMRQSVAATVGGINALFDRLGSTERVDQFWGKLEQSEKGRGGVFAGGQLASGKTFGESAWESGTSRTLTAEEALRAFSLDLQQSVIQALQASDGLPQAIAGMLDGIDAEALGQEQVSALLASIEAFSQLSPVFSRLGVDMADVRVAAIEAAGGVQNFGTVAAAYYDATRSESEKLADATQSTRAAFEALGVRMPESVQGLRAVVEQLQASSRGASDEGQTLAVQLMALAPAMAALEQSVEGVVASIGAMTSGAAGALSEAGGWPTADDWVKYAQAIGDPETLANTLQRSFAEAWERLDLGEAFPAPKNIAEYQAVIAGLDVSARESLVWAEKLDGALNLAPEFSSLVDALNATGQGVAATVDRIAQSMNTLSNLSSLYSHAEYKTLMEPLLQQQFAAILGEGSAMPTTAAAMRDLVESITDPDVKASLAEFVGQWDDFYVVQQKVATSAVRATSAVNSAAEAMRTAMQGVAEYVQGLFTSQFAVGSPEEQLAYARSQYDQTYARAQGGDAQAMADVTRYADQVFRLGQDFHGGATGGYVQIFEQIVGQLQALTGSRSSSPSSGPTRGEDLSRAQLREQQRGNRLSERQLSMAQRAASRPSYAY